MTPSSRAPSTEALALFFRSLSTMQRAGISLTRCFFLLGEQAEDPNMGRIAKEVGQRLQGGSMLSQAFSQHKEAFSTLQIRLVQIGERTGSLSEVLRELAEHEEKRRKLELRVRSSLAYPCFISIAALIMIVVLPPYMLSGLFRMIETSGVEPPLLTRLVLSFSHLAQNPVCWVGAFLLGSGAMAAFRGLERAPALYLACADRLLATPVLGRVYRLVALTRFARALAVQLRVGDSPLTGLRLAAEASGNPVLIERIPQAIEALKNGSTLVNSLADTAFFPPPFLQLMRAGEETAMTPEMTARLGDLYEAELECALETFVALLEPLVMLGLGIAVGILVIATMLPMLSLLQTM